MTDKELLELAAKAAGIKRIKAGGPFMVMKNHLMAEWNPLTDDGDALRLSVKLRMNLDIVDGGSGAQIIGVCFASEPHLMTGGHDPYAATRRAIVRAAAEVGKALL